MFLERIIPTLAVLAVATTLSAQSTWTENTTSIYPTDTSKKVGIGTDTPQTTLDVEGTLAISNNVGNYWDLDRVDADGSLRITDSGVERLRVSSAGNVGIGSASPGGRLHIIQNSDVSEAFLLIEDSDTTAGSQVPQILFRGNGTSFGSLRYDHTGARFRSVAEVNLVSILDSGVVGIGTGTATPLWGKLKVEGNWSSTNPETPYSSPVLGLRNTNTENNAVQSILFTANNASAGEATVGALSVVVTDHTAGSVDSDLYVGTTENNAYHSRMVIKNSGNVGIGTSTPGYKLHVVGNAHVDGTITGTNIQAKYQDVAEWVPAADDLTPGTVVVLDTTRPNHVVSSSTAYDTMVAGVVSLQPGLILGEGGAGREQIATTGRVRVRVDATRLPIRIGDLLVTSDRPGMAMRSVPRDIDGAPFHRPGTIVGKALEPLERGEGEILVLLSLQ